MSPAAYLIHHPPSVAVTEQALEWAFEKWDVRDYHIDYNVQRARMRSTTLERSERAVTVRWIPRGAQTAIVISSDDQDTIAANLRKLYLGIEAMRLNEKRGLSDVMRTAYLQISGPTDAPPTPYQVLGVAPTATRDEVRTAWLARAREVHPDVGGSTEQMATVNWAHAAIVKERGW